MERPHHSQKTKVIRRRPIWDPMPSVLILEDKGGVSADQGAEPRDPPLTNTLLAMLMIMVTTEARFLLSQVMR